MKKIIFLISTFLIINSFNTLKANNSISLKDYLKHRNIEEGSTQIYLLNRCSAVYAFASAIILESDTLNSKKFIEIANNLLFKSVELRIIDDKENSANAKRKAEKERKKLFKNYTADGKKNWDKNKSYFKGSYISEDMLICSKLVEDK
ncbi:SinI family restriction endonuclease [Pelagibacteraceae bacterium]|nr:SinI family restriction endonuclease [Pelagibacteraceae bacterium]